jgi:hypothetical protein
MTWLLIAISAYLILAIVFLVDKHLLTEKIPDPKLYAFYSGILGFLTIFLIPFVDFKIISLRYFLLALLSGVSFFVALFLFYRTLKSFEVSRVVPAIGALIPLFSLALVYLSSKGQETLTSYEVPAFVLLILGGFLISFRKEKLFSFQSLFFSAMTSFFFSLHFVSAKYIYINYSFWNSLIWLRIGGFLMALIFFFLFKEIRDEILIKRKTLRKETSLVFLGSKILSAGGGFLQNYAVFLAPSLVAVALINGLQGTQYAFLLIFAVFLSVKYPDVLKEEITKKIIAQKVFSIILIIGGLLLLSLL